MNISPKRGRPKTGKKLDPNYALLSGFVQKSTGDDAKHFLVDNSKEFPDMGALIDLAIIEFFSARNYGRSGRER